MIGFWVLSFEIVYGSQKMEREDDDFNECAEGEDF
jgi:hypothetical protein